ncbi:MAG: hypothetical protein ACFFEN_16525 [Candidatus Thorarchaeota archaeon]
MPGPYDDLEKEAEKLEKQSKEEFTKKNFTSAISLLESAREIYSNLGYQGKIGMIDKRLAQLKNLIKFQQQDSIIKTKSEVEFQQRVDKTLREKHEYHDKNFTEQKAITPEMKKNLEKVNLLVEKANKEEKLGKYKRVIGRYEYILELYRSIPQDIINLSSEIEKIEKKLSDLRTKI